MTDSAANKPAEDKKLPASNQEPNPGATPAPEEEEDGVQRCHDCRNRSKKGCANDRCRQCCFRLDTKTYIDCSVHPRGQVRKGTPSLRDFTGKLVFYRPPPPPLAGQPGYRGPMPPGPAPPPAAGYGPAPGQGYAGGNTLPPPPPQQYSQGPAYPTTGYSQAPGYGSAPGYHTTAPPRSTLPPGPPAGPVASSTQPAPHGYPPQQQWQQGPPPLSQPPPPRYVQSTPQSQSSSAYGAPATSQSQPPPPSHPGYPPQTTTTTNSTNNTTYMSYPPPNNRTGPPPPEQPRSFPSGPSHLPPQSYSSQPMHYAPPGGPPQAEFMRWGEPALPPPTLPQYSPILRTQHQHNTGIDTSPQLRRGPYGQGWHAGPPPTSPLYAGHRRARPTHEETTPSMNQGRQKRANNVPDMGARQTSEDEDELKGLDNLVRHA
eukprot:TRINITY_DN209_c0_g1_i1.p1 TRINITY_DN209_c0_g1~~TRINITY_DN209_c0_g1_i1.p1  ORF type:complete len:429 (-),score=31.78 TRINITY_DN209_c0_g1_i1:235-1521(-)